MSTKHTAGPWKISTGRIKKNLEWININDNTGACLADLPTDSHGIDPDESLANAKLIAASPELLEAAKEMCDAMGEGIQKEHDAYNKLMLAINKATNQ